MRSRRQTEPCCYVSRPSDLSLCRTLVRILDLDLECPRRYSVPGPCFRSSPVLAQVGQQQKKKNKKLSEYPEQKLEWGGGAQRSFASGDLSSTGIQWMCPKPCHRCGGFVGPGPEARVSAGDGPVSSAEV